MPDFPFLKHTAVILYDNFIGMTKNNMAFTIVVTLAITLLVLYFTYPLAMPPQKEQPIIQQQEARAIQTSPLQVEEKNSDPGNGAQQQRIDSQSSEIIKSTPTKAVVRFYTKPTTQNIKFLTAYINGMPTEMIFDTGASFITVNNQTMNQLRITTPLIRTIANTASGPTYAYQFKASTIKVGSMELKNVQCSYLPAASENLLGGSFLSNFHYYINESDHTITFIPNSENVQITDSTIDPVSGEGWAEIDGKKFIYREGHFEKQ
jgi:clan AA aspartic protease (TIGR02281 family)